MRKRIFFISIVLVVLILYLSLGRKKTLHSPEQISTQESFVATLMFEPWKEFDKIDPTNPKFLWLMRQCYSSMMYVSPSGQKIFKLAKSLDETKEDQWILTLKENLHWEDKKPLDAQDILAGWKARKTLAESLPIKTIELITVENKNTLRIQFKKNTNYEQKLEAISSPFLAGHRLRETTKEAKKDDSIEIYTLKDELAGLCYGDFKFDEVSSSKVKLSRINIEDQVNGRRETSLLQNIELINKPQPTQFDDVIQMFRGHTLAYAIGVKATTEQRTREFSNFRSNSTGPGYYLLLNPKLLTNSSAFSFYHAAINRGELVFYDEKGNVFKPMYTLLPESMLLADGTRFNDRSRLLATESVSLAKELKKSAKILKGLHYDLPDNPLLGMVLQRIVDRVRADHGIEVNKIQEEKSKDASLKKVFGSMVSLPSSSLLEWTREFEKTLKTIEFEGRQELLSMTAKTLKFLEKHDESSAVSSLKQIESKLQNNGPLIPLGQIANEYMIDPAIAGIQIFEDPSIDPDFSAAVEPIKPSNESSSN